MGDLKTFLRDHKRKFEAKDPLPGVDVPMHTTVPLSFEVYKEMHEKHVQQCMMEINQTDVSAEALDECLNAMYRHSTLSASTLSSDQVHANSPAEDAGGDCATMVEGMHVPTLLKQDQYSLPTTAPPELAHDDMPPRDEHAQEGFIGPVGVWPERMLDMILSLATITGMQPITREEKANWIIKHFPRM
jgi:hypothetical protein